MATLRNTPDRYGIVARLLHGAMLLTIGANLALGLLFDDAVETGEGRFAALHATLGILTLLLLVARLVWRIVDPPPPLTVGTPAERAIAHAGHYGLYALILLVTMSGWLAASGEGQRIDLLGGMALPSLSASASPTAAPSSVTPAPGTAASGWQDNDDDTAGVAPGAEDEAGDDEEEGGDAELWEEVHELGSWALLALVLLHAAAALMHLRKGDGTWARMFG